MAAKTNKKDVLLQATIKKQMLINGIDTRTLAGMMNYEKTIPDPFLETISFAFGD